MMAPYYLVMLTMSVMLMIAYLSIWHKHFDLHITLIFILVPIANLGYLWVAGAQTLEAALMAYKVAYIGGCYLELILMLAVFGLCDIKTPTWVRIALVCLCTLFYLAILSIGSTPWYYKEVTLAQYGGVTILDKRYGPVHTAFLVMEVGYFCATLGAVIYSYLCNRQVSRKNLRLLFLTELVAMICFFAGRRLVPGVELLPVAYNFALVLYLVIASRLSLYDVTDSAIDSLVQTGETGFVSFDFDYRYLGSNQTAKGMFPQLAELTVDRPLAECPAVEQLVLPWLADFSADQTHNEVFYDRDEQTFRIVIQHLYSGWWRQGYQLMVVDDTKEQRYIRLLNTFNTQLQDEVGKQMAHVVEMHDNLVMSMAIMVESRDNSTGGHIRRTSEGVRLLIEQLLADGAYELSDEFCRDVIKAAPMHDLGKIAVDDAVLRKPGRFTPEEFDKMKRHAAEGARIVHEILRETDNESFKRVAENVAHYHHERWDGSGYPDGLAGDAIPLEARIMAIADVYDALVSKRVYKEAMAFDRADAIIMEGMGTQFDQGLESAYVRARPYLEQYYQGLE